MNMRQVASGFALFAAMAAAAIAQQPAAGAPPEVDPDAIAVLNKMSAYLRSLKAYRVKAETSREEVLTDGQKVTFSGVSEVLAQPPNRARTDIKSDRQERTYFYDGKTFTIWAPRTRFYATVPAPATLTELATDLEDKYDLQLPLVDLFFWGTDRSSASTITSAIDLGPGEVEGLTCEHYLYRQPGLDWQIWIQLGDYPLPRKLVLTTLTDDARPQYRSVMTWNLAPSFNEAAFRFVPPSDAAKIKFVEVSADGGRQ